MSLAVVSRSCALLTLALLRNVFIQPQPCCHLATERMLKAKQLPSVTIVILRDVPVLLSGRYFPLPFHVAALDAGDIPFLGDFAHLCVAPLKIHLLPPNSAVPS